MADIDRLPLLMQKLPQEVYDNIHNLVFTTNSGTRVNIVAGFRLPAQLFVSKAHRQQFAASYFRNSIFIFTERVYFDWTAKLRKANFDKIAHVEIHDSCASAADRLAMRTPLKGRQWRLNRFGDIINMRKIFPEYVFTHRLPSDPSDLKYFSGTMSFFVPGPLQGHWTFDHTTESTKFTKVAGPNL